MDDKKTFFKSHLIFHRFFRKIYWGFRKVIEKYFLGTRVNEFFWRRRYLFEGNSWPKENWGSYNHPRVGIIRQMLINKILNYFPLKSVLEIGCGSGPNLYLLSKRFPKIKIYGMDVNEKAILFCQKKLQEKEIKNVSAFFGKADNLKEFNDKSIDIVFTMSVMFYIGPDKIKKVINEMIRVAKKAIIFFEPHNKHSADDPFGLGIYQGGQWLRNYQDLLKNFGIRKGQISLTKIPKNIWGNDYYGEIAHIIEVNLNSI